MPELRYYYLSLEGESELLYFKRLEALIHAAPERRYEAVFDCVVNHSPGRSFKRLRQKALSHGETIPEIWHIRDMEERDNPAFYRALRELKQTGMRLCYSNYTFELWLLLHRCRMAEALSDKRNYLKYINRLFGTYYGTLHEYKEKQNQQKLLDRITLEDVRTAVVNAESIMHEKEQRQQALEFCGFRYYPENPATTVQVFVRQLLTDCGLI